MNQKYKLYGSVLCIHWSIQIQSFKIFRKMLRKLIKEVTSRRPGMICLLNPCHILRLVEPQTANITLSVTLQYLGGLVRAALV